MTFIVVVAMNVRADAPSSSLTPRSKFNSKLAHPPSTSWLFNHVTSASFVFSR